MENTKKVTIQDVAKYANVSVGTIDRVIHDRGKVSPDKKQRIEEAIRKLDFNPNFLARTLALGNRYKISTLVPAAPVNDHYWSLPKNGIDKAAGMYKDFGIEINSFFYNLFDEESFVEQANKILETNTKGVILAPLFLHESLIFIEKLKAREIPYIFIDSDIQDQNRLTYIGPDVLLSGYIAAKLLNSVVQGTGDVLIMNIVKGIENAAALKRMETGFRNYFQGIGLNRANILTLSINSSDKEDVYRELTKFYIKNQNIKGVFVTNSKSYLVSGFHLTHELDIRVVGYDLVAGNIEHLKKGVIDYIISQNPVQQGIKSVQTLFDFFIYKNIPRKVQYVPLDIIIRENVDYYVDFQ